MPADDDADFDLIRRTWGAGASQDADTYEQGLHPDVTAIPFGAAMEGKSYRGREEVMGWWHDELYANWEHFDPQPQEFQRVGKGIFVTGRWRARGRTSGVELDIPAAWVIEMRDGLIWYFRTYSDIDEARRDIGLES